MMLPVGFHDTGLNSPLTGFSLTDCTNPFGSLSGLAALLKTFNRLSLTKHFLESVPCIPKLITQYFPSGFQLIFEFSPAPSSTESLSGNSLSRLNSSLSWRSVLFFVIMSSLSCEGLQLAAYIPSSFWATSSVSFAVTLKMAPSAVTTHRLCESMRYVIYMIVLPAS